MISWFVVHYQAYGLGTADLTPVNHIRCCEGPRPVSSIWNRPLLSEGLLIDWPKTVITVIVRQCIRINETYLETYLETSLEDPWRPLEHLK